MKPRHNLVEYAINLFAWNKKAGVADASTLRCRPGQVPGEQVYDDAADHGFWVRGTRTGQRVLFTLLHERRTDGEITHWVFSAVDAPYTITIFNT